VEIRNLEGRMAAYAFVGQQFRAVVLLVQQNGCRVGRMQSVGPTLVFLDVAGGAIGSRYMGIFCAGGGLGCAAAQGEEHSGSKKA
jgi:hypothetical protein